MADWNKTMTQTFDFFTVNPVSWLDSEVITTIKSAQITRDLNTKTLASATFESEEQLDEQYVRIYLRIYQNNKMERFCLGTFLLQASTMKFDGKLKTYSYDGYSPLIELDEKKPEIGYSVYENQNISTVINQILREQVRCPFVEIKNQILSSDDYVAGAGDTWLSFLTGLLDNTEYSLFLRQDGTIEIIPDKQDSNLMPSYTYSTDENGILQSDITVNQNLFGVPNVVEVIRSNKGEYESVKAVNSDENSPVSLQSRGREILYREINPNTNITLEAYAKKLLIEKSTVEYTVDYVHGYCPVMVGDCVRLKYPKSGLEDVRAKVISQTIECSTGCQVTETVKVTQNLWKGA